MRKGYKMPGATILSYVKSQEKEAQIQRLCKRLQIQSAQIGSQDMGKELGELCGIYKGAKGTHAPVPLLYQAPELLIFSGIPEGMLDLILAEYRKEGIEPVALKAIVTPHNIGWTFYELSSELAREHAAMHRR